MENSKDGQMSERRKQYIATGMLSLAMLVLFAFYANLRWTSQSPAFEKAKETADTPAYLRVADEAFLSGEFWANTRPPVFPLVLKLFAADEVKVASFQTVFSIFAWGTLAFSLSFSLKKLLRPFAFALILVLSLERHIAGWDVVMLTESLSISLLALFLASWLWLLRKWSWWKVPILSVVSLFWAFTRDTNGWILLMVAGLILLGVLIFRARKRYLVVALVFSFIFVLSNFSAERGNRWIFPFQNVLAQRILPDQQAVEFFADCGMPLTPELLELAGGFANSNERAFYTSPALESYREWLDDKGKSCYVRWLIYQPVTRLREPWVDFAWLLAFENVDFFFPQRYEPILPWYVERILYPQDAHLWIWGLTTIAALFAIWKKAWRANPAWAVFIGLCMLIYPHVFIVWHGDISGTHRHALTVSLQFVLGLWIFSLLFLEMVLTRHLARNSELD